LIAHFDPATGAAGDMILGALVDAGAPLPEIRRALASLPLPDFRLEAEETRRGGFRATLLSVEIPDESTHRHLPEIEKILGQGELGSDVVEAALRVFRRLAQAEAVAHGIQEDQVHFHEVGALDAIVDIAGTALALKFLAVEEVTFSPLRVGTGEVKTAHGILPVPVPAVLELTKGLPIVRTEIPGEILTPTGAAILTALGHPVDSSPFVAEKIGVAFGTREFPDRPNLLRVSLGRRASVRSPGAGAVPWEQDEVEVLETNLDDMSPETLPSVLEEVLAAGALDAYLSPVLMKKGRPGQLLTVLVHAIKVEPVVEALFRETTTFGVRRTTCPRWKLARQSHEIESPWGPVQVKVGDLGGGSRRVTPEYESCRAIADRTGTPLLEVYREVEQLIRSSEWIFRGEPDR
jgi:uncharacterized protein (TIGR00299 family) protein